jgi:hypothetical protein
MTINLMDLRAAVSNYIRTHVIALVSSPVADMRNRIGSDEEFSFSVTASNSHGSDAIRLVNVVYHVWSGSASVELKVPAGPPARASCNPAAPTLAAGSFVSEMFLFPVHNSLDVGDADTIVGLKGKALELGTADINFHVHADPDLDFLFPKNNIGTTSTKSLTAHERAGLGPVVPSATPERFASPAELIAVGLAGSR